MNINLVLNAVPPTKKKTDCVPAETRTVWEIGKWGNKGNILDRAEEMGLLGEKKDGPFVSG